MEIVYPYKFKLNPTDKQKEQFRQFAGARRWVWNQMLDERNQVYKNTGKSVSKTEQMKRLTKLKNNKVSWLNNLHSQVLQQSIQDLDQAFDNFFNKSHGYPNFKSKKDTKQTFRFPEGVKTQENKVYLPKIGWVKFHKSQKIEGEIKSATIKRQAHGWFISINTEQEINVEWNKEIKEEQTIGIDLGLKEFAVTSDGTRIQNPKFFRESEKKLKKAQQKLSRKEYGSNNYQEQKNKVSRIHATIRRKRTDFLHKLSTKIVSENQAVIVEDLNVDGMIKSNLGKSIHDAGWSEFVRMLEYKCQWSGTYFVKIDQFFPSSKTCRHCGLVNEIDLSDREFECDGCHTMLKRDLNASKNIKQVGLNKLADGQSDSLNASGELTSDSITIDRIEVDPMNEEPSKVAKLN